VQDRLMGWIEALAFSSLLPATVAGALALAAGLSLGECPTSLAAGLAFAGTLAVYNVDRLRDLERDRSMAPRRSAFVMAQYSKLVGIAALATGGALALGWRAGPAAVALCGTVLLPALFHRRLKRHVAAKIVYITAAWIAVVVGLPALEAGEVMDIAPQLAGGLSGYLGQVGDVGNLGLITCIYTGAIGANLIASNLGSVGEEPTRGQAAVWGARGLAAAGVLIAFVGPPSLHALACVPLAQFVGLLRLDGGERTRLIGIDGSLLLGALAALAIQLLT
jgi:hypothetical protein